MFLKSYTVHILAATQLFVADRECGVAALGVGVQGEAICASKLIL